MKTMKRLLSYLRYEKKGVLIGLVCLLISTVATLTGPLVAKYMIDNVITPMGQSHVFDAGSVLLWVGIYVVVNLVGAAGGYLNRLYMKTLSNRVAKRIRDEVFEHVQILSVIYATRIIPTKITSCVPSHSAFSSLATILSTTCPIIRAGYTAAILLPIIKMKLTR